jgi:hypothetical protein
MLYMSCNAVHELMMQMLYMSSSRGRHHVCVILQMPRAADSTREATHVVLENDVRDAPTEHVVEIRGGV